MKQLTSFLFTASIFWLVSCSNGQTKQGSMQLSVQDFAQKISTTQDEIILDVRTPEEFAGGHLTDAVNIDRNSSDFSNKVAGLDKSKPVFVYCLSGGRSSSAAGYLRADGFKEVYEMVGGMMKWRAANLPETTSNEGLKTAGITLEQFHSMLLSDKAVLVDFYAPWCAPCKKMAPYLDEISKEMSGSVTVIRINVDENQELVKALHIEEIPVLQIYKKGELVWNNKGFVPKEEVVSQLK